MSDTKFTKGPWTVVHNGYYYEIKVPSSEGEKVDSHSPSLASTIENEFLPGFTAETEQANAYMLAAAPGLYRALSLVLAHLPEPQCAIWKDVHHRAELALAEATPQTQETSDG